MFDRPRCHRVSMIPMTLLAGWLAIVSALTDSRCVRADEKPPTRMTPELLWKLGRIGSTAISNDGNLIAYTVRRYELAEDSGTTSLFVIDRTSGGTRQLIKDWKTIADVQFGKSPFGQRIYMTGMSGRDPDAKPQAWAVNPVDGGIYQVTEIDDGIANLKIDPTGGRIAFTVDVKLDDEVKDLYKDLPKADARIIDSLMFRHWNAWHDYRYSHLHVAALDGVGRAGPATDLMKDRRVDCPVPPFGGSEQFDWAPDGTEIAFTMKDVKNWAQSTNSDVYVVDVTDPESIQNITEGMLGYDNDPVYSPDGRYLAFHSMRRPGFESDRNRIMIYDRRTKAIADATSGLDQTAHGATWAPDSGSLYFTSEWRGTDQIFQIPRDGGSARQISNGWFNWRLRGIANDGSTALVSRMNMIRPTELDLMDLNDGATETMTDVNGSIYQTLELPTIKERWVKATDGKSIHCWVIYPPGFDENKKWPLLTYCQGGPQGQIGQWFSYRWNFHLMAANDYVIVAPNRRGLPGFGRQWNDQISRDWGGQAMQDILSATDEMRAENYIDEKRVGAIGASFGGYTVYWLMGNHGDRFACMIAHCGVFNLESMYGSTEELFFVNYDLGGPYWQSPEIQKDYDRFSPHRFVKNWKTPLLVIHGEQDFRVPVTQGIEAFTAAQVQGVPSRFLYFPNEGHWVLGPQNGVLWHRVFFDWLDRYCKSNPTVTKP